MKKKGASFKSIVKGIRIGSLGYKPQGSRRTITKEIPSSRKSSNAVFGYNSLSRKFQAGSRSANPFANRLARIKKKLQPNGRQANRL